MLTIEKYAELLIERIYDILSKYETIDPFELVDYKDLLMKDVTYQLQSLVNDLSDRNDSQKKIDIDKNDRNP